MTALVQYVERQLAARTNATSLSPSLYSEYFLAPKLSPFLQKTLVFPLTKRRNSGKIFAWFET
jgi:hypothetical protein